MKNYRYCYSTKTQDLHDKYLFKNKNSKNKEGLVEPMAYTPLIKYFGWPSAGRRCDFQTTRVHYKCKYDNGILYEAKKKGF